MIDQLLESERPLGYIVRIELEEHAYQPEKICKAGRHSSWDGWVYLIESIIAEAVCNC